ncbi:hypothetical protein CONPUDRAFT_73116 [Coniophora puteana RWD-64-598 SS2]|uniref:G-protein coupled receptors family 1 profile domain-containing protein n=1 Tax=Coniophora puteana (strain RWD-64-598) TaxID=741705 RepID=A0A5M3MQB7_CONPW|nr:uncharacterized protein CONPUDRAFT_73116 [Coniophora puteana RWD-64-598 SS2]EIW81369.1 hypothetical protein CONPUDRAFT_73116 [Coniophora puteana RWD-64-598 SS2]
MSLDRTYFDIEIVTHVTNTLMAFLIGVNASMYMASLYVFSTRPRHERHYIIFYAVFGGILLLMMILDLLSNLYFSGLVAAHCGNETDITGVIATLVPNVMADALMLWRCYVIWERRIQYIFPPALLILVVVFASFLTVVEKSLTAEPMGNLSGGGRVGNMIWNASTAALNVWVTSMICYRLGRMYWSIRTTIQEPQNILKTYTGVVSITIEGTIPFTLMAILNFALQMSDNSLNAPAITVVSQLWCGVCFVSIRKVANM